MAALKAILAPKKGLLLVARPELLDPNFARSVVLLAEHGDGGSLGFVLTRPSGARIREVAPEFDQDERREPIWLGGPVQTDTLWVIHQREECSAESQPVMPGVWYGGAPELIRGLLAMPEPDEEGQHLRLFAGYAGWSEGQLLEEIREGAWAVIPFLPPMLFGPGADGIWRECLRRSELPTVERPEFLLRAHWS